MRLDRDIRNTDDCLARLKALEAQGRVWGQDLVLQVKNQELVLSDVESKVLCGQGTPKSWQPARSRDPPRHPPILDPAPHKRSVPPATAPPYAWHPPQPQHKHQPSNAPCPWHPPWPQNLPWTLHPHTSLIAPPVAPHITPVPLPSQPYKLGTLFVLAPTTNLAPL